MTEQEVRLADLDQPKRLRIQAAGRNPYDAAREVVGYLRKGNDPPRLFRMGNAAILLLSDGSLEPFDNDAWLAYVAERVDFIRSDGKANVAPEQAVLRITTKLLLRELPQLDGVVSAPYLAADGALISDPGYNPETRLVLRQDGLTLPPVSETPTAEEVQASARYLTREWLADFPFATAADRANAVAELLTLTGRELFPLAPLLVHDASASGSGKGLLLDVLSIVLTGQPADVMELPPGREEQQKTILSVLLSGRMIVAWDELHVVEGTSLAAVLTAENYGGRLLGVSKMIQVRNKLVFFALGNNIEVHGDMKRRVLPSRLVPDTAHPEKRSGFRHPDLKEWTAEHRGELLAAAFTLWRHWIASGKKPADISMGSFDRWARTVGGVLQAAGITGFASNVGEWLTFSEDDSDEWHGHLRAARLYFGERWFTAKQAADAVEASRLPRPPVKPDPDKELHLLIGYGYRKIRDRWHSEYRLIRSTERDGETGARTWHVEERGSAPEASSPSSGSSDQRKRTDDTDDSQLAADDGRGSSGCIVSADRPLTRATDDTDDTDDGFAASGPRLGQPPVTTTDSDESWVRDAPDDLDDDPSGWGPGTVGAEMNPARRIRCPDCGWKDKTAVPPGGHVTCKKCGTTFTAP